MRPTKLIIILSLLLLIPLSNQYISAQESSPSRSNIAVIYLGKVIAETNETYAGYPVLLASIPWHIAYTEWGFILFGSQMKLVYPPEPKIIYRYPFVLLLNRFGIPYYFQLIDNETLNISSAIAYAMDFGLINGRLVLLISDGEGGSPTQDLKMVAIVGSRGVEKVAHLIKGEESRLVLASINGTPYIFSLISYKENDTYRLAVFESKGFGEFKLIIDDIVIKNATNIYEIIPYGIFAQTSGKVGLLVGLDIFGSFGHITNVSFFELRKDEDGFYKIVSKRMILSNIEVSKQYFLDNYPAIYPDSPLISLNGGKKYAFSYVSTNQDRNGTVVVFTLDGSENKTYVLKAWTQPVIALDIDNDSEDELITYCFAEDTGRVGIFDLDGNFTELDVKASDAFPRVFPIYTISGARGFVYLSADGKTLNMVERGNITSIEIPLPQNDTMALPFVMGDINQNKKYDLILLYGVESYVEAWGTEVLSDLYLAVVSDILKYTPPDLSSSGSALDNPVVDTDGDGISDFMELRIYKTNPYTPDTDYDLLSDYEEIFIYHTNPHNPDTDGDGISDYTEVVYGLDPNNANVGASRFQSTNLYLVILILGGFIVIPIIYSIVKMGINTAGKPFSKKSKPKF